MAVLTAEPEQVTHSSRLISFIIINIIIIIISVALCPSILLAGKKSKEISALVRNTYTQKKKRHTGFKRLLSQTN